MAVVKQLTALDLSINSPTDLPLPSELPKPKAPNPEHMQALDFLEGLTTTSVDKALAEVAEKAASLFTNAIVSASPPTEVPKGSATVPVSELHKIFADWNTALDTILLPAVGEAFGFGTLGTLSQTPNAYELALENLGAESMFNLVNGVSVRTLSSAKNLMVNIGDDVFNAAKDEITKGFIDGESMDQIAERIRDNVPEIVGPRALVTARTEVIRASNAGSYAQAVAMGAYGPVGKQWLATHDDRTRETHKAADLQKVDLQEAFNVGGWPAKYPGDPALPPAESVNCRCTQIWIDREPPADSLSASVENEDKEMTKTAYEEAIDAAVSTEIVTMADSGPAVSGVGSPNALPDNRKPWSGIIALEGKETGDGREFAPGALIPADPMILAWQKEGTYGHDGSVVVGNIDSIERKPNGDYTEIHATGTVYIGNEDGVEAYTLLQNKVMNGVSVDIDDQKDADVEYVYPEDPPEDSVDPAMDGGENIDDILFGPLPDKVIFHTGRIRGATIVSIPAFVEAQIYADDQSALISDGSEFGDETMAVPKTQESGAFATHKTDTVDTPWDGPSQETNVVSPNALDYYAKVYAWHDVGAQPDSDGNYAKDAMKFIHHEIAADGTPGAANLTACSTGIGVLNGGRGGSAIPDGDIQGVYDHLASHLKDGGKEAPQLMAIEEVITAGGPMAPPRDWFNDPQLSEPTALKIGADGRVFGHLALFGTCHTGVQGACVTPPKEDDYAYFLTGEVLCDDGESVPVGHLTIGTGHAGTQLAAKPAVEHYDHTGHAISDIAVGSDKFGIWCAGSVRPGATDEDIHTLRASAPSGDWRRIGGRLRLVAALAVNVPGFPVPRARVLDGKQTALVAAGAVHKAKPHNTKIAPKTLERIGMVASGISSKRKAKADELAAKVHQVKE